MTEIRTLSQVREVLSRHRQQLLTTYSAAGVGIGKRRPEDRTYIIVVYLKSGNLLPKEKVSIEGVQLKFQVTGPLKLL